MGTGVGTFLLAVGAVLTFAVDATVTGIDINAVGVILMLVGILGVAVDLIIFAPRRRTELGTLPNRSRTVVHERNGL